MVTIEQLAQAAMGSDALETRSLLLAFVQDWPRLDTVPQPATEDATLLAVSAGLVELLAEHRQQQQPEWTATVPGVDTPVYLGMQALSMDPRWRAVAEAEAPLPLRRRNLYAMPEYLTYA